MPKFHDTTIYGDLTVNGTIKGNYAAGDILYASEANTLATLTKGTNGQVLKLVNGLPAWGNDNDTNNYLTGISGSGNGTVTFTRSDLSNLTWDASHVHQLKTINGQSLLGTGDITEVGPAGASAGFGTPTITIDSNVGTPSATVTASGPDTAKIFTFGFKNLKGAQGNPGDDGTDGTDGKEVEMQVASGFIQWRYVGDTVWKDLVSLATITGAAGSDGVDGRDVKLRVSGGFIQWQYDGDVAWTNLVSLSTLTGPAGNDGTDGTDGTDGVGISSITKTSGNGSAGTTDTYTITFTNSTTSTFTVYNGANGTNGTDGIGISSTTITYKTSSSGTYIPTGTWYSNIPSVTKGQYLWTRTIITFTDSTTKTSYSVSYHGLDGADAILPDIINFPNQDKVHLQENGTTLLSTFSYGLNANNVTPEGRNVFVGNAGNTTMGSTATSSTESSYNTALGNSALLSNTKGYNNTAIGYNALRFNTTGTSNTALGNSALYSNTTGTHNTALGYTALRFNTSGTYNTAIGYNALGANKTGSQNTAIGYDALCSNTTSYYNTAIGRNALYSNTSGTSNTAIGFSAGMYIANGTTLRTTGSNSVFIGYDSKASANGVNNEIVIGFDAVGKGTNTVTLGNSSVTKAYVGNSELLKKADIPQWTYLGSTPHSVGGVEYYSEDISEYIVIYTNSSTGKYSDMTEVVYGPGILINGMTLPGYVESGILYNGERIQISWNNGGGLGAKSYVVVYGR